MATKTMMRTDLRIGVALGAGGAAAIAQVGVLEELEAAGLRFDCVAGTSAGAIIGAAYAAGRLEEFGAMMRGLTRRRVLWLYDLTWPRTGLLEGRRAMALIRPYVGERIETLPRPFAAVATELPSGTEIVLRDGDVVEAIRASIAIPGIFTPHRRDGRVLVDGGLVNPVPVSVVRELGADFTLAVSVLPLIERTRAGTARTSRQRGYIPAQLLARFLARLRRERARERAGATQEIPVARAIDEELGIIEVLLKASRVVESHIAAGRLREGPPDFLLSVPLPEVGIFDFHRARELIEIGRAAARRALPELRAALATRAPLYRRVQRWLNDGRRRSSGRA